MPEEETGGSELAEQGVEGKRTAPAQSQHGSWHTDCLPIAERLSASGMRIRQKISAFQYLKTKAFMRLFPFSRGREIAAPGLPGSYSSHQKHAHKLVLSYSITPAEEEHVLLLLLLLKKAQNIPTQAF